MLHHYRFRLIARSLGVFLQCQLPVDPNNQVHLRTVPNAPGHVKDAKPHPSSLVMAASYILPTKQAEQGLQSLEGLLNNKLYSQLGTFVTYAVEFVCSPNHTVLNSEQLLMWLSAALYPNLRYLDLLRVCHA